MTTYAERVHEHHVYLKVRLSGNCPACKEEALRLSRLESQYREAVRIGDLAATTMLRARIAAIR